MDISYTPRVVGPLAVAVLVPVAAEDRPFVLRVVSYVRAVIVTRCYLHTLLPKVNINATY